MSIMFEEQHRLERELKEVRADIEQLTEKGMELDAWCKQLNALLLEREAEIERLERLILGACNIFCNLDAPNWAAEFERALVKKS